MTNKYDLHLLFSKRKTFPTENILLTGTLISGIPFNAFATTLDGPTKSLVK